MNKKNIEKLDSFLTYDEKAEFMADGKVTVGVVHLRDFNRRYIGKVRGIPVGRTFQNPRDARECAISFRDHWRKASHCSEGELPY